MPPAPVMTTVTPSGSVPKPAPVMTMSPPPAQIWAGTTDEIVGGGTTVKVVGGVVAQLAGAGLVTCSMCAPRLSDFALIVIVIVVHDCTGTFVPTRAVQLLG